MLAVFDFKTQVEQYINSTSRNPFSVRKTPNDRTVFTVFFGIQDVWEYAALEKDRAMQAIERSISELFHNLDRLAEHAGNDITVVVPRIVDLTFLPRFQALRDQSPETFAQKQHQYAFLANYWNTVLSQAAVEWRGGSIFQPQVDQIVVSQVRAKQLYSGKVEDAFGLGRQMPVFDEVEKPCLTQVDSNDGDGADAMEKCFKPDRHLFWYVCSQRVATMTGKHAIWTPKVQNHLSSQPTKISRITRTFSKSEKSRLVWQNPMVSTIRLFLPPSEHTQSLLSWTNPRTGTTCSSAVPHTN